MATKKPHGTAPVEAQTGESIQLIDSAIVAQPAQDNAHVAPGAELFPEPMPEPVAFVAPAVDLAEIEPPAPVAVAEPVEALSDYLARIEEVAQPLPVCEVTHPNAVDGAIHAGVYAGIRLVKGDKISARLSDGSTL